MQISHADYTIEITAKGEKALGTLAQEMGFAKPEALLYLLDYGFRQSLSDKIAGLATKLRGEGREAADIEAAIKAALDERLGAILAGEVGSRSAGPRLKPLDKLAFDQAVAALRAIFAKKSRKWPSGEGAAKEVADNVQLLWSKYPQVRDAHYTEAERQLAAQSALDLDL